MLARSLNPWHNRDMDTMSTALFDSGFLSTVVFPAPCLVAARTPRARALVGIDELLLVGFDEDQALWLVTRPNNRSDGELAEVLEAQIYFEDDYLANNFALIRGSARVLIPVAGLVGQGPADPAARIGTIAGVARDQVEMGMGERLAAGRPDVQTDVPAVRRK